MRRQDAKNAVCCPQTATACLPACRMGNLQGQQDGVPSSDWYMPSFMSISTGVKVGSHTAFEFPLEKVRSTFR